MSKSTIAAEIKSYLENGNQDTWYWSIDAMAEELDSKGIGITTISPTSCRTGTVRLPTTVASRWTSRPPWPSPTASSASS